MRAEPRAVGVARSAAVAVHVDNADPAEIDGEANLARCGMGSGEERLAVGRRLVRGTARHDPALRATQATAHHRRIREVIDRHGRLDIVIAVHARSSEGGLAEVTEVELDQCWAANVRSIVMLAQRFGQVHEPSPADQPPIGRMVWFTSGQALSPMDGELAYAVSKGALHQMTGSVAHALVPARIVANCINPGPVDTGYAPPEVIEAVERRFPDGRWGRPDDVANLVAFLVSDEGAWIRGQVIDSEGGFDRH